MAGQTCLLPHAADGVCILEAGKPSARNIFVPFAVLGREKGGRSRNRMRIYQELQLFGDAVDWWGRGVQSCHEGLGFRCLS